MDRPGARRRGGAPAARASSRSATRPAAPPGRRPTRRPRRRPTAARFRRRRLVAGSLLVAIVVVPVLLATGSSSPARRSAKQATPGAPSTAASTRAAPAGPAAVESGLLSWQLGAPVSREVVLPGRRTGELVVAGGLISTGGSSAAVLALDTTSGHLVTTGSLRLATHDAAGALVGGRALVLGGGTVSPSATTQRFAPGGGAVSVAALPEARARTRRP